MRPAIDAVRATGTAVAEVALCYTGDLSDPGEKLYTLDYYLRLAERIVDAGAHILAIKDMAGLLRAPAARTLVTALRERFDLPVHLHTHDTPGGQLATLLAAVEAGVDAVDAANAAMSGTTSQPSLSSLVAATDYSSRETGLSLRAVCDLEPYWEAVRRLYAPFESGPARADRSGLPPRDPRRPALQPAPAGDRARPGREVRADRGHVRRRQRHPRQHRQGDAEQQGRGRPGAAPGRGRRRPAGLRRQPREIRHPRLRDRLPVRRARRSARRLAGAVPDQGTGRPDRARARQRAHRRAGRRAADRSPPDPRPDAVPRTDQEVRGVARDLRRRFGHRHGRVPLRAPARTGAPRHPRARARPCYSACSRSASPTSAASAP